MDEQMISFSGSCPYRQYIPKKPNPVGIKNFVMASVGGLMLDFDIYQGAKCLEQQVHPNKYLSLGTMVLPRLSETLTERSQIYCDRYFTSYQAMEYMLTKNIYLTGTIMKNRIQDAAKKLPCDKYLKKQGRGSFVSVIRRDGKVAVSKWYDNKPILLISAVHEQHPEIECRRWSKQEKKYV